LRIVALLMIGCVLSLAAPDNPTPAQKKTQHTTKKASTKKARTIPSKTTAKASAKTSGHHAKTAAKHTKTKSAAAASWRSRQLAPTADRYKEIQSALASKGYLNQPANGVWDPQSTEALRRFQHDQNLEPSGKLNSLSLIALGLGAKRATMASAPAAPPAVMTPRPPSIDAPPALPQNAIPQSPPPSFAAPELPASPPGDGR
jgi:peptidoglycan hydrolase-like protein with peptidoglycan-binding domain